MSANAISAPAGDLRGRAARGTLVNAAFEIALSSLALVKGFVVAGFLSRSEFGIWGILVVVLVSLLWLKQVGIGDKYVQQREGDQRLAFQKAFTLELAFNAIFFLVLAAALPLVALVYGQPTLIAPGLVLSLAVLAVAFQTPSWVWYRSMRYGRQRTIQAVDPVVGFAVTIALAIGMAATAAVSLVARSLYLAAFFDGFRNAGPARASGLAGAAGGRARGRRAGARGRRATAAAALAELALYAAAVVAVTMLAERAVLREALGYLRRGRRVVQAA
jgi:hypothetical protein